MNRLLTGWLLVCVALHMAGCATDSSDRARVDPSSRCRACELPPEITARIMALNPMRVSGQEVAELLSQAPAPQVISIHGGVFPIKAGMNSLGRFLIGMGYPEASIRNPGTGEYAYGYYDDSDQLAGAVAWYYERDGLRPVLIGHSQGGIQVMRVLHKLAGDYPATLPVWNPERETSEARDSITDPLTGTNRPVVGVQVSYAAVALAGGLARMLPNEWDMNDKLREIPDSVGEFTGFQKGFDPFGGDFLGFGPANNYHATGRATVRNVRLPSSSTHWSIPYIESLLKDDEVRAWIHRYQPVDADEAMAGESLQWEGRNARILWAAEIWHGIKKHWVLELQRLIRAQRTNTHDR